MFGHRKVQVAARARAADGHQKPHRRARFEPVDALCAVVLDVLDQLMVDVVTDAHEHVVGHRLQRGLCKAVHLLVAEVGERRLHRVDRAFRQMQTHRPVVRNRVDDVGEPRVHRALRRPDVCADVRNVLRKIAVQRHEQLGVFLILRVIGDLAEALAVHRLPHELVEQSDLLRQLGTERIEVVLRADHLRTGRVERGKVHPHRRAPERLRARCDRHRDAVMPEAHADVADDQRVLRQLQRLVGKHQILNADLLDLRDRLKSKMIGLVRVVAELFQELFLALFRLLYGLFIDRIAENNACSVHFSSSSYSERFSFACASSMVFMTFFSL